MKNFKLLWLLAVAGSLTMVSCDKDKDDVPPPANTVTVTFDQVTLPADGYLNNTSYTEKGVTFNNAYNADYVSWDGFAVSNLHDKPLRDMPISTAYLPMEVQTVQPISVYVITALILIRTVHFSRWHLAKRLIRSR